MTLPRLLTVKETAEVLRLKPRAVWALIAAGRLRVLHPVPGRTVISETELEAFLKSLSRKVA